MGAGYHAGAPRRAKRGTFSGVIDMNALEQWLHEGETALETGDMTSAIAAFSRAQRSAPADPGLVLLLANAHRLAGDMLAARDVLLAFYRNALPRELPARFTLGAALLETGAPQEAADCFAQVVAALPRDPAALGALAAAKRAIGETAGGWPLIQRALAINPRQPAFLLTAAQLRHDLGDVAGALRWLDAADQVRPAHAPTLLQRAYSTLIGGASAEGWRLFEHRPLPVPAGPATAWHGEPLRGQSILVTAEQGVGDQFQFLRFLTNLGARGAADVVVQCHADAVSLLAHNRLQVVPRGKWPNTDWHVPLLSLPHRLRLADAVQGDAVPYLRAPHTSDLALPASTSGVPRLGLVWAGNPAFSGRITRDLDPALLPALLGIPRVRWISLQQGERDPVADPALHRLPPMRDWAATASVLAQLDGLVTTDTGIAHLAGAMGVRTWVLLQHVPDWRWGLTREISPWYPSLTLIRPDAPGDWGNIVAKLARHLERARGTTM